MESVRSIQRSGISRPAEITIFRINNHKRSQMVTEAMARGIVAAGEQVLISDSASYREPTGRIAVFYGFDHLLRRVFTDYVAAGLKVVFADLGYWGRRVDGRYRGYHKLVVNSRHPNAYFSARQHDDSRAKALGLTVKPWRRSGTHILLAGMGQKAALAEGLVPYEWERMALAELRKVTDRPIIYRPKPNDVGAPGLVGAGLSPPAQLLESALADCWATVSHHSNVCVEGLVEGIPAFCVDGAALPMGLADLAQIESPRLPDGREQWVNDLAYTQWTLAEMGLGLPWRHLREEGLLG